jgi:hypothetical protein
MVVTSIFALDHSVVCVIESTPPRWQGCWGGKDRILHERTNESGARAGASGWINNNGKKWEKAKKKEKPGPRPHHQQHTPQFDTDTSAIPTGGPHTRASRRGKQASKEGAPRSRARPRPAKIPPPPASSSPGQETPLLRNRLPSRKNPQQRRRPLITPPLTRR